MLISHNKEETAVHGCHCRESLGCVHAQGSGHTAEFGSLVPCSSLLLFIARTPRFNELPNFKNEMVPPTLLLLLRGLAMAARKVGDRGIEIQLRDNS